MTLATTTTPGSVILGGDLTGTATAPELRITGVTAGSYSNGTIVVDTKGRVIFASSISANLIGDVIGPYTNTQLTATGVTAGLYSASIFTVDAKGRITSVTAGVFGGDLIGNYTSNMLSVTGVTAGSYTNANITVDAKGRISSIVNGISLFSGELNGNFGSNSLSTTGITAGTYTAVNMSVDIKGRITTISSGASSFNGDVTGLFASNALITTGVSANSYTFSTITVDSKGRITSASSNIIPFSGDINGSTYSNLVLATTGVSAGSAQLSNITVDAKGRITAKSSGNVFGGDVTGTIGTASLNSVGPAANSYTTSNITVDAKGRVTAASSGSIATTSTLGLVSIALDGIITVAAGVINTPAATSTSYGVISQSATNTLSNVSVSPTGDLNLNTTIIPLLDQENIFSKQISIYPASATSIDLDVSNYFYLITNTAFTVPTPINGATGNQFTVSIQGTRGVGTREIIMPLTSGVAVAPSAVAYGKNRFVAVSSSSNKSYVSTDGGVTWTTYTAPISAQYIVFNGVFFCAVGGTSTMTSSDGINWQSGTTGAGGATVGLDWNGTYFIVANGNLPISRSTDGLNWTTAGAAAPSISAFCCDTVGNIYSLNTTTHIVSRSGDNGNSWSINAQYNIAGSFNRIALGMVYSTTTNYVGFYTSTDNAGWATYVISNFTTGFSYSYVDRTGVLYLHYNNQYQRWYYSAGNQLTTTTLTSGGVGASMAIGDQSGIVFCECGSTDRGFTIYEGGVSSITIPSSYKFSNSLTQDLAFGYSAVNFKCTQVGSICYCTYLI